MAYVLDRHYIEVVSRKEHHMNEQMLQHPDGGSETVRLLAAGKPASPPGEPARAGAEPSAEAISRRAYQISLDRGGSEGSVIEDWLRAEEELRREGRDS